MELLLREEASPDDLKAVMRTALEKAKAGSDAMIKLILELHVSKGTTQDNSKAAEKVQININGPTISEVKREESAEEKALVTLLTDASSE